MNSRRDIGFLYWRTPIPDLCFVLVEVLVQIYTIPQNAQCKAHLSAQKKDPDAKINNNLLKL